MSKLVLCVVILIFFLSSTLLFKKAAGTLGIGKLNVVSLVYYLFMLQTFLGIALIMLGFRKHYTLSYLIDLEQSCKIAFCAVMIVSVLLPLSIVIFQKALKLEIKGMYNAYLKSETVVNNSDWAFVCLSACAIVCILLLGMFLIKIGYVPLVMLVRHPQDFPFALERARIAGLYVGHPYISNILILGVVPLLSYIAFSYAMLKKTRKWILIFAILFIASVIVKTYKFEKAPLIFHLLIFMLIYVYFKGGIRTISMSLFGIIACCIMIVSYYLLGFEGTILDIYNGPLGRTIFTQVGTLTYAFDMFPDIFPFLDGRSFAPNLLKILGRDSATHLRSAKIIMAFYGSEKVYDGGAGVMNTVFIGEAYANWGYVGVLFSAIWVGVVIGFIFWTALKLKKTPITIAFLAVMTVKIGITSQGGFCDFIYNIDLIMTFGLFVGGYYLIDGNSSISNSVYTKVQSILGKREVLCDKLQNFWKK